MSKDPRYEAPEDRPAPSPKFRIPDDEEEQRQRQHDAAEVFEKIAAQMRAGEIRVIHLESQVEDDWVWSHNYFPAGMTPTPRFFRYTIKVENMGEPEEEWEVFING